MSTATTIYQTADLGVAALLIARGFALLRIEPGDGRRKLFVFSAEARTIAEGYFQGTSVPARAFFNAIRDLKALVSQR